MYDVTKTRMLLTTAVFAAVAVMFAGGANARALAEDGSRMGAEPAAQASQGSGTFSVAEICAALELEQLRGVLVNEPAIKAATPDAIQECSYASTVKSLTPVLAFSATQKRAAPPRASRYPDGRRSVP